MIDSDEKRIEAVNRYKINPDNALLKNSLEIEKNPMAKTYNAFNKAVSIDEEGKYRVAIKGAKNP